MLEVLANAREYGERLVLRRCQQCRMDRIQSLSCGGRASFHREVLKRHPQVARLACLSEEWVEDHLHPFRVLRRSGQTASSSTQKVLREILSDVKAFAMSRSHLTCSLECKRIIPRGLVRCSVTSSRRKPLRFVRRPAYRRLVLRS